MEGAHCSEEDSKGKRESERLGIEINFFFFGGRTVGMDGVWLGGGKRLLLLARGRLRAKTALGDLVDQQKWFPMMQRAVLGLEEGKGIQSFSGIAGKSRCEV
jgi:hypothetical protein